MEKKCQKLVPVDPLQQRQAKSFTQQTAKKNRHISKVLRQHIINSSSNDKGLFLAETLQTVMEVGLSISFSIK